MDREQLDRNLQLAEMMRRSRRELGQASLSAASQGAITKDAAKALNLHLGVSEHGMVLAHSKRARKVEHLRTIAEAISERRHHLASHRIVRVNARLKETAVLAAAVGETSDHPFDRSELIDLPIVQALAEHHRVDPNFAVDQTVARDLLWLYAPTAPR